MGERDDARHQVEQARERMSAIAHELSRRMTPEYAKERAKTMARDRATEVRDRAAENPWMLTLLGAGIGALVGRAFQSRMQDRYSRQWRGDGRWEGAGREYGWYGGEGRYWEPGRYSHGGRYAPYGAGRGAGARRYVPHDDRRWEEGRMGSTERWDESRMGSTEGWADYPGYEEETRGAGGKASELEDRAYEARDRVSEGAAEARQRASELKDRATAKSSELRERASGAAHQAQDRIRERASELRERVPDRETMRASAEDQLGLWALGAMAVGALLGFAVPVSPREREILEPARRRFREAAEDAKERLFEEGSEAMDRASEKVESAGEEKRSEEPRTGTAPVPPIGSSPPDPLH
jgi:ElaB/YqjD/DUF883 family membrane-anchored ribosome-binding protein